MTREHCPSCGSERTEFVQFADGTEETTLTTPEQVGRGLLELRQCMECAVGIENVLTVEKQRGVQT